jgi:lysophospholipase L1-like esterase
MPEAQPLVHVVGDSISVGYGPWLEKFLAGSWRYSRRGGEAEARLNLDLPVGANSGDSAQVLEYLRGLLKRDDFRPDLLLVNCGLHDIKCDPATGAKQVALPDYGKNLREIVQLAAGRGIPLAWVRTTHVCDEIHNAAMKEFFRYAKDAEVYDEVACKIMTSVGIPVIDLCEFTRKLGSDRDLFVDHVHFSEAVQQNQAAFLAGWLQAWRAR